MSSSVPRFCGHCGCRLRSLATVADFCRACLAEVKVPCPVCGHPKRLDSALCRHCHGVADPFARVSTAGRRSWRGRCRGRMRGERWEPLEDVLERRPLQGCGVRWGNLDHVHCACGRPMSPRVEACGHCVAELLSRPPDGNCLRCGLSGPWLICVMCRPELEVLIRRHVDPQWLAVETGASDLVEAVSWAG